MSLRGTIKVEIKDKGWNRILKNTIAIDNSFTAIGFFSDSVYTEDNLFIATIAAIQEFGTNDGKIPERSFMRSAIDANKNKIIALGKKLYMSVQEGKLSAKEAVAKLGVYGESIITKKLTTISNPPNAPSTIAAKGSSNPLIDTGEMRAAIRHEEFYGRKPK